MNEQNPGVIYDELEQIKAKDIMSRFAITIKVNDSLLAAAHLMIRFKISGLPVVSDAGAVVGILTATDLFRLMGERVLKAKTNPKEAFANHSESISEVMTKQVYTIHEDTSLADMILLMYEKNIHTLPTVPVVKGNEIVGVIGRRDVLYTYYKVLDKHQ